MLKRMSAAALLCSILPFLVRAADDVENVIARSAVILERPNLRPAEAMPLGNGRLGIAVWGAEGLTVQLNRIDTLPGRLSPGQIVIPGLKRLMKAKDFAGRLDLYNGEFSAQGDGMRVAIYVQPDTDLVVVDVHGANPRESQTAIVRLWPPRRPAARQSSSLVALAETWTDNTAPGASGQTFGSIAALTARVRNVQAGVDSALNASVSFLPENDGSYRVLIAAPYWAGGDALAAARLAVAVPAEFDSHRRWWNALWHRVGLMKVRSRDGSAEYLENLRLIDLFTAAAESGGAMPGSQAGVGDLFSSSGDFHRWDPSAFWHWNLRMQVSANLGAGLFELNEPYFRLYRDNLQNIERWTASRMGGKPGACVPETMRFNGVGFESEAGAKSPGLNCDEGSEPYYNARTISTGAEVSWWIWRQYLMTGDRQFLEANYPVMAAAANFLLAYSRSARTACVTPFHPMHMRISGMCMTLRPTSAR